MNLASLDVDILRHGLYIGERDICVRFALSNTDSPYKDIPITGTEYDLEEVLLQLKDLAKKKPQMICFTGGEPLLQIDFYREILDQLPLPLHLETNGTLPEPLKIVAPFASRIELQLLPDFIKEFTESLIAVRENDISIRLIVTKDSAPQEVENYAKVIASVKNCPLIIEPIFGVKNYLSLQAMALRHLSDVRVIPRMHL
jgi:organic radical activating enzyme